METLFNEVSDFITQGHVGHNSAIVVGVNH
jgi:hypothetical protein